MTPWHCPRCGWSIEQPDCVAAIGHRCNPAIPKTWTALERTPTDPTTNQQHKGNTND